MKILNVFELRLRSLQLFILLSKTKHTFRQLFKRFPDGNLFYLNLKLPFAIILKKPTLGSSEKKKGKNMSETLFAITTRPTVEFPNPKLASPQSTIYPLFPYLSQDLFAFVHFASINVKIIKLSECLSPDWLSTYAMPIV